MNTQQLSFWLGEFGQKYTERNKTTPEQFENIYLEQFGMTKTEINKMFLDGLGIERILEVGCNVGDQLRCLQGMGYQQLYGVELQRYAVERSHLSCPGLNIIQGSGFDLPFKDKFFDLVFTNGVLIHIAPADLPNIMEEMVRVSKRYIWGFEYYAESIAMLNYRGEHERMWKGNYAELFLDRFPALKLVKSIKFKHLQNDNYDEMYLLEKITT